ncbi:MAG: Na+/H+ antiporter subunit E [Gammaproteobacteria bacterium]|nr:Na+/H+ antiporter subunit E [Gammaproteobacteria bacterium]MBT8133335.1 Na+/H+ antiporter subunit E [Gammaproteobacteria bacterium]NNJ51033.1 Na+/H+ antiporter subunit E [Gammaproteobacteria bacterium]
MKSLRSSAKLSLALLAFWLILTAGDPASLIIAALFIVLAILLKPPVDHSTRKTRLNLNFSGVLQFAWFFMLESLRGGIDVSRRVLSVRPRVDAVFYDYSMRLQRPYAQQLFISSISLLPGTLCADLDNQQLHIHTLDRHMDTPEGIRQLESLVGKIFGEAL